LLHKNEQKGTANLGGFFLMNPNLMIQIGELRLINVILLFSLLVYTTDVKFKRSLW
jgi:hypothetical protein